MLDKKDKTQELKPKVEAEVPGRQERILMFMLSVLKFFLNLLEKKINIIRDNCLAKRMDDKNG